MNDGRGHDHRQALCQGYGYFKDMKSYDELMEAWDKDHPRDYPRERHR